MKKKHLRKGAKQAEKRAEFEQKRADREEILARSLAAEVARLKRQVEDMREHWAPVPITHPWQPKDPQCMFCDEPRDAARHQVEA